MSNADSVIDLSGDSPKESNRRRRRTRSTSNSVSTSSSSNQQNVAVARRRRPKKRRRTNSSPDVILLPPSSSPLRRSPRLNRRSSVQNRNSNRNALEEQLDADAAMARSLQRQEHERSRQEQRNRILQANAGRSLSRLQRIRLESRSRSAGLGVFFNSDESDEDLEDYIDNSSRNNTRPHPHVSRPNRTHQNFLNGLRSHIVSQLSLMSRELSEEDFFRLSRLDDNIVNKNRLTKSELAMLPKSRKRNKDGSCGKVCDLTVDTPKIKDKNDKNDECAICLGEMFPGEEVRRLPCIFS